MTSAQIIMTNKLCLCYPSKNRMQSRDGEKRQNGGPKKTFSWRLVQTLNKPRIQCSLCFKKKKKRIKKMWQTDQAQGRSSQNSCWAFRRIAQTSPKVRCIIQSAISLSYEHIWPVYAKVPTCVCSCLNVFY